MRGRGRRGAKIEGDRKSVLHIEHFPNKGAKRRESCDRHPRPCIGKTQSHRTRKTVL